jgi:hypothetical protein
LYSLPSFGRSPKSASPESAEFELCATKANQECHARDLSGAYSYVECSEPCNRFDRRLRYRIRHNCWN